VDALVYLDGGLGPTRTAWYSPGDPSASPRDDPLSVLPQALPLSACAGPAAHLLKRSMRLPGGKPPTATQSSHHATHNPPPELTTRREELTKRYTNQVQTSTIHTQWNANKYTSLSHQKPACKYSSNGIPERSTTCRRSSTRVWRTTDACTVAPRAENFAS